MVDEVLGRLWSDFERLCSHTAHLTYEVSRRMRKRVEEIFGWLKTVGMTRKVRHRGLPRVDWIFTFALAAQTSSGYETPPLRAREDTVDDELFPGRVASTIT